MDYGEPMHSKFKDHIDDLSNICVFAFILTSHADQKPFFLSTGMEGFFDALGRIVVK
jgi:hypothetical protein